MHGTGVGGSSATKNYTGFVLRFSVQVTVIDVVWLCDIGLVTSD